MHGMLNISEGSTIALHAALLLAKKTNEPLTTKQTAETLKVSAAHLSKVFQRMAKAGIVRALRGPKGGYILNKPLSEIRLLDVFESIDGSLRMHHCLLKEPRCGLGGCILGGLLASVNSQVLEHFNKRLSDL